MIPNPTNAAHLLAAVALLELFVLWLFLYLEDRPRVKGRARREEAEVARLTAPLPESRTLTAPPEEPLALPAVPLPSRLRTIADVIPPGVEGVPVGSRMSEAVTEVITAVVVDDSACDQPCTARHCADHAWQAVGSSAQRNPDVAHRQRTMHMAWNGPTGAFQILDEDLHEVTRSWGPSLLSLLEGAR